MQVFNQTSSIVIAYRRFKAKYDRNWFEKHCARPANNDHLHGPGVCPHCGEKGLRHRAEGGCFVISGCDHCGKATLT